MKEQIDMDVADGTLLPWRYDDIYTLLDAAKECIKYWDIDKTLDIIGEINLDALHKVDLLDDFLLDITKQLNRIQEWYVQQWKTLPREICLKLADLKEVLNTYDTVSQ